MMLLLLPSPCLFTVGKSANRIIYGVAPAIGRHHHPFRCVLWTLLESNRWSLYNRMAVDVNRCFEIAVSSSFSLSFDHFDLE